MHGVYNVKLVNTVFHRCNVYVSFFSESSEQTNQTAWFLFVRLHPALNFEGNALNEIFTRPSLPQMTSNSADLLRLRSTVLVLLYYPLTTPTSYITSLTFDSSGQIFGKHSC